MATTNNVVVVNDKQEQSRFYLRTRLSWDVAALRHEQIFVLSCYTLFVAFVWFFSSVYLLHLFVYLLHFCFRNIHTYERALLQLLSDIFIVHCSLNTLSQGTVSTFCICFFLFLLRSFRELFKTLSGALYQITFHQSCCKKIPLIAAMRQFYNTTTG